MVRFILGELFDTWSWQPNDRMWFWLDGFESCCVGVEGSSKSICVRRFFPSALSLFRFHLSPFPPETPDTQASFCITRELKYTPQATDIRLFDRWLKLSVSQKLNSNVSSTIFLSTSQSSEIENETVNGKEAEAETVECENGKLFSAFNSISWEMLVNDYGLEARAFVRLHKRRMHPLRV